MQGAGGAARGPHVRGVDHGVDESSDHLRGVHDGVPAGLLLGELVDHNGGLADHAPPGPRRSAAWSAPGSHE